MLQLQQRETDLATANMAVIVVAFEKPEFVRIYLEHSETTWPENWSMISNTDQSLYELFQMRRANWWDILRWRSLKYYLYLVFQKRRKVLTPTNKDLLQLGGDVLVDPSGTIRMHHRSEDPADRPSIDEILALTSKASASKQL